LERLAALDPFGTPSPPSGAAGSSLGGLRASTEQLLEKGKTLPFGARLVYVGPVPGEKDFRALETLRLRRLSLEYFLIDEKNLEDPGFQDPVKRRGKNQTIYQIQERGYEIL
jgi:hypothetical protein